PRAAPAGGSARCFIARGATVPGQALQLGRTRAHHRRDLRDAGVVKILYLSPIGAIGGAERVLLAVMKSVRSACPDAALHLLTLSDGPLVERAASLGAGVTVLPLPAALMSLGDSQLAKRQATALSLLRSAVGAAGEGWKYLRRFRQELRRLAPALI